MPAHVLPSMGRRRFLQVSAAGAATFLFGRAMGQDGKALRLAMLADTHIPADKVSGTRGFNAWAHFTGVVPDIIASKPDGMLIAGDAARLTGEVGDYEAIVDGLVPLREAMPVYIAMGNHDNRENFYGTIGELEGDRPEIENEHVTVIEHDVVRMLLLDSLLYTRQRGGHFGKAQREWLSAFLTEHTERPVVLVLHHTLGEGDNDLLDTELFFRLLEPHKQVKAIFHGHSHRWERYERQGIPVINLPAMGHIWTPEQPLGWVDATFRADGMDLTLRAFGGNREEDGKVFPYTWA